MSGPSGTSRGRSLQDRPRGGLGLVLLARDPRPGEVKTRLAADLGPERAAQLYRCFLHDTLAAASRTEARVFIAWAGASASSPAWLSEACPGAEAFPQEGDDLGARMVAAATRARGRGCERVVVIGSDSPSLPSSRIAAAARRLGRADVVLGPTRDGGYYLIAARAVEARLFAGVAWSSADALRQTRANAERLGLRVELLPGWYDVDTADDLRFLEAHLRALEARGLPMPCPHTGRALPGLTRGGGPPRIGIVIPALNEEASIARVLDDLPRGLATEVVVVDNGSTDGTAEVARARGARVVSEPERGYGVACQAGIAALDRPDIIVFLDGDYSDHAEEMDRVVAPIVEGRADLVVGSRLTGRREPGSLPAQSVFGNWVSSRLLWHLYRRRATDLGPFRAIRADALMELGMADRAFGWTMEMQAKAARAGLRTVEVPVSYRRRIGESKITGTLSGSVKAGVAIIAMVLKTLAWRPDRFD